MSTQDTGRPIDILLVEDNPGDVRLTQEALREGKLRNSMSVVSNGVDAVRFLKREGEYADAPRPDLVFLDLNLPRKGGHQVLAEIKADPDLRRIPIVVMTTSNAEDDIKRAYDLNANCYVTKPVDLDQFLHVVQTVQNFWLSVVKLPAD